MIRKELQQVEDKENRRENWRRKPNPRLEFGKI